MTQTDPSGGRSRLRLFGRFSLSSPDGVEVTITSRRGRALLAYLFLSPDQEESRERLCGLLWSDRGEVQARASLRQCLLELRDGLQAAGLDLLAAGRDRVALAGDRVSSDLTELQEVLGGDDHAATIDHLGRTERRQPLEDIEVPGLFDDWLSQTRPRIEQAVASQVRAQLERFERAGRWSAVRAVAEAFLRRDPLDEAVAAAAIRADAATGNTAAAHRRFKILQDAMGREYGASPGATAREALARAGALELPARTPVERPASAAEIATPPLVIVASFETSHATKDDGRLAATLRDEIVAGLSRFRDLRVVAELQADG